MHNIIAEQKIQQLKAATIPVVEKICERDNLLSV